VSCPRLYNVTEPRRGRERRRLGGLRCGLVGRPGWTGPVLHALDDSTRFCWWSAGEWQLQQAREGMAGWPIDKWAHLFFSSQKAIRFLRLGLIIWCTTRGQASWSRWCLRSWTSVFVVPILATEVPWAFISSSSGVTKQAWDREGRISTATANVSSSRVRTCHVWSFRRCKP
jgi:hypothetical protein